MATETSACDPGAVRGQLERLLASPEFSGAARLSGFLRFVVEEALSGRASQLKGYTIGLEVFKRDESFDPQTDPVVRVEAGRLRRRLREYYLTTGRSDPVQIEIPKGTYAPIIRSQDGAGDGTVAAGPTATSSEQRHGPSIAVLPFQNYSGDPNDQFFADGLTEETIANLCHFKDLFVFSRSTTTKLARAGVEIPRLRERISVDFVLEGSVRKTDRAVRVTIQLIDAATDGHILSEHFDRPCTPEGVFEIQDEIALHVAGRVADRHGPLGRYAARAQRAGRSERWETYVWITRFYDYYAKHDPQQHLEVREGLEQALERDPGSSDGWAAQSLILLDEYRLHVNERRSYPALERALEHALRAATCDPENAFAYQVLALAYFHGREFTDFRVAAERAVKLNPGHADVLADIGFCHAVSGNWDSGLPLLDRAIELSPVHPGWYRMPRAIRHGMTGDAEAAVIELKQAPMPGFFWYHAYLAWFFAELGDKEEAASQGAELLAAYPEFAQNARHELQIWCVHDALAEKSISGWRKAGLKIE